MGAARPLHKTDELGRANERIKRLLGRLARERDRRIEAEENARRFHALMLEARIQAIRAKQKEEP